MFAVEKLARRGEELIALGHDILSEAIALGAMAVSPVRPPESIGPHYPVLNGSTFEAKAQALYAGRRIRDGLFSAELFGEPSWDILLDLFIASRRDRRLSVSTVCIGAQVPSATALRYIRTLEDHGLIQREKDRRDSRRTFLRLTSLGMDHMTSFFKMTDALQVSKTPAGAKLRLANGNS